MASQQQPVREKNKTEKREVDVVKNIVPKMTSHFESLAEKDKDSDISTGGHEEETGHFESIADKVKDMDVSGDLEGADQAHGDKQIDSSYTGDENRGAEAEKGRVNREEKSRGSHADAVGKYEVQGEEEKGLDVRRVKEGEADKDRSYTDNSSREEGRDCAQAQQDIMAAKAAAEEKYGKAKVSDNLSGEGAEANKSTDTSSKEGGVEKPTDKVAPSLEDISKYREVAQQNSMEVLRAAEERYAKAKELSASALQNVKETTAPKLGATTEYATQIGSQAKDTVLQGAAVVKETAAPKLGAATEYVTEKGGVAKDVALEKGATAKDTLASAGKTAMDYTTQTAVAAKDSTLKTGKGAGSYAGKVAADLKDKAVVAGWAAAHYTTEKAVEGTKMAARATGGAVGYAEEKAVAAKDVMANVGQKALGVAAMPVFAAKDAAVSTGETVKEYTASKKEEAQRELEAKRSAETKAESGGQEIGQEAQYDEGRDKGEEGRETKLTEGIKEERDEGQKGQYSKGFDQEEGQQGPEHDQNLQKGDGGVLGAIGETIAEIAETTKHMVVGPNEEKVGEEKEHGYEAGRTDKKSRK